jgi:hypothetical protein
VRIDEIVCEARYQGTPLLYHATSAKRALAILKSGVIEPRTEAGINGKLTKGTSLTRSFWFASMYHTVIFGLNMNTVRDQYRGKMSPYADPFLDDVDVDNGNSTMGDYRREAEEFVTAPLKLAGHLVGIWIGNNSETPNHPTVQPFISQIMKHPLYRGMVPDWPHHPGGY